jgi:hypothetical protein
MEGSEFGPRSEYVQIISDPDPGGPKIYASYGTAGSESVTLLVSTYEYDITKY